MTHVAHQPAGRTHALAGIAAAVAFFFGILLEKWPGGGDSSDTVAHDLSTHGHRIQQFIAGYLLVAAGLLFLWFVAGLRQWVAAVDAPSGTLTWVTSVGGGIATALLIASGAISVFMAATVGFGEDVPKAAVLGSMGWIAAALAIFSMLAVAVVIVAVSSSATRNAVFPRWFAWLGYLCALALALSLLFITMLAFPIWLIVASLLLLRRREAGTLAG